jgi:PhnB protein
MAVGRSPYRLISVSVMNSDFVSTPVTSTSTAGSSAPADVRPIPAGMRTVTPHLVCAGAAAAIAFYGRAFGALEEMRVHGGADKLVHALIRIGDSAVMLVDEFPEMGCLGPKAQGGSAVTIHLFVPDVDAVFQRVVDAGAIVKMPVQDRFWGDRYGLLEDPFGHSWSIATHLRDLTAEEIEANMRLAPRSWGRSGLSLAEVWQRRISPTAGGLALVAVTSLSCLISLLLFYSGFLAMPGFRRTGSRRRQSCSCSSLRRPRPMRRRPRRQIPKR